MSNTFSSANFSGNNSAAGGQASQADILAGFSTSLDNLSAHGKAAFELLSALGPGAHDAQMQEARRLAQKHGPEHPYVQAANARMATLQGLAHHAGDITRHAGRLIENDGKPSMFHGYVFNHSGKAVPNVTVELCLLSDKDSVKFHTGTNAEGYFRMELLRRANAQHTNETTDKLWKIHKATLVTAAEGKTDSLHRAANVIGSFLEQKAKLNLHSRFSPQVPQPIDRNDRQAEEMLVKTEERPASAQITSSVSILDGKDNSVLLYSDPTPPQFTGQFVGGMVEVKSQFRVYTLP